MDEDSLMSSSRCIVPLRAHHETVLTHTVALPRTRQVAGFVPFEVFRLACVSREWRERWARGDTWLQGVVLHFAVQPTFSIAFLSVLAERNLIPHLAPFSGSTCHLRGD